MKNIFNKMNIVCFAIILLLFTVIFPYAKVEYLTLQHGQEFVGLEQQVNMINQSKYHKVFVYDRDIAQVFYVSQNSGNMITFIRNENKDWVLSSWNTIWSKTGSADEFIWPYYR